MRWLFDDFIFYLLAHVIIKLSAIRCSVVILSYTLSCKYDMEVQELSRMCAGWCMFAASIFCFVMCYEFSMDQFDNACALHVMLWSSMDIIFERFTQVWIHHVEQLNWARSAFQWDRHCFGHFLSGFTAPPVDRHLEILKYGINKQVHEFSLCS